MKFTNRSAILFFALSGEFKRAGAADSPGRVHSCLSEEEMCPPRLSLRRSRPLQQDQEDRYWQRCLCLQAVIQGLHTTLFVKKH